MEKAARPGLSKVRTTPLIRRRELRLFGAVDGRWRDLLDEADVVSEGFCRDEGSRRTYYGSTSLLVLARTAGGWLPDAELASIAHIASTDPHVRLRALRVAYREAASRAAAPLEPVHAEISVTCRPRGLLFAVDVVAQVFRPRRERSGSNVRSRRTPT